MKNNEKYLNSEKIRIQIKTYSKFVRSDILQELNNLSISNINDVVIEYNEYQKITKKFDSNYFNKYTLNSMNVENKYKKIFKTLDDLVIDITEFLKFLLNRKTDLIDNNLTDLKTSKSNKYVVLENIKGNECNVLSYLKTFLEENKPFILKNKPKILTITERNQILSDSIKCIDRIISIFNTNKISQLRCNGLTILHLQEFFREREILISKSLTSVSIENYRFKLKELIFVDNEIITDEFRFELINHYFDIWVLKTNIVINELTRINYRFDLSSVRRTMSFIEKDTLESKYRQACFVQKVINKHIFKYEIHNAFISTDIDLMNEAVLLPLFYPCGYKHKSKHIEPKKARMVLKDKITGKIKQIRNVKETEYKKYNRIYNDDTYLTVSCDTEIEWIFELVDSYENPNVIKTLSREEWINYIDENIKDIREKLKHNNIVDINMAKTLKTLKTRCKNMIKNKCTYCAKKHTCEKSQYEYETLDINDLKYKIRAKSKVLVIQAMFSDSRTGEKTPYLIVKESKKEDYNKDFLEYTYLKNKEEKHVKAKVVYSNDIVDYYYNLLINWYKEKHSNIDGRRLRMNVFFHNIKFDSLCIGLLDLFDKYNFSLSNMNLSQPFFVDFNTNFELTNSKGKEIKSKIVFLDSMSFQATSLENLGKSIGIRKEKEKVDFEWNNNLKVDRKMLEYSVMDIVILDEFITDLKKEVLNDCSFSSYGAAGLAFSSYLTSNYGKEVDKNRLVNKILYKYFDETGNEIARKEYAKIKDKTKCKKVSEVVKVPKQIKIQRHKNRILEMIALSAYTGGRTECFRKVSLFKFLLSIDLNSSYPSSMYQKLPYEYYMSFNDPDEQTINEILNNKSLYSIAYIYIKESKTHLLPVKMDFKVCFPDLYNTNLLVHEPELKKELSLNKDNITVLELHTYFATDKLFEKFVDEGMFGKSYYKIIEKNDIKVTYYKLTRNSCYGKFGEKQRVSITKQMDEDEKEFFKLMLSVRHGELYNDEMLNSYIGYIDLEFGLGINHEIDKIKNSGFEDDFNIVYQNKLIEISNMFDRNSTHIRVNIMRDYYSFTKKIERPSENASPEIAGAITSYSRVALYNAMEIIGFDRLIYCDTDSIYFELRKDETIEDIKLKYFNVLDIEDEKILKSKYVSIETYKKFMKEIESKWVEGKINTSKGLVSRLYLWEIEHKKPFVMLVRGNKDNIKCLWTHEDQIFVYDEKENRDYSYSEFSGFLSKELFDEYYNTNKSILKKLYNPNKYKYCMTKKLFKEFEKTKSVYQGKYLLVRFNEKMKGISKSSMQVNDNCYITLQWLSMKVNANMFGDYSHQYVIPMVKNLEGRGNYLKAEITKKSNKTFQYGVNVNLKDINKNDITIGNSVLQEVTELKKISYVQQIIKPFEVTNINSYKKYNNNDFMILNEKAKLIDFVKNDKIIVENDFDKQERKEKFNKNLNRSMSKEDYKKMRKQIKANVI